MVEGLSSQSVRPLRGLTGEAKSRPGVTVAGVAPGVPLGMGGDPEPCTEYTAVNNYICLGRRPGAPKWVPGWWGRAGRGGRRRAVLRQGC